LKSLLVVVVVVLLVHSAPRWHELSESYSFEQYLADFGKEYGCPRESAQRRQIFEENLGKILSHNSDVSQTWKMGVNAFTDMTRSEINAFKGYDKVRAHQERANLVTELSWSLGTLPSSIDWRDKNIMTAVKDQGNCGSCWAFASTECIESHLALQTGILQELSPENLVACVVNSQQCGGTGGCSGATSELAFAYVQQNGIASEWTYPYTSYAGVTPNCSVSTPAAKISGFQKLGTNSYSDLMNAIATVGPIAVSVDAGAWDSYETGIFNSCNQTHPDIDHAVLLVGYGDGYWTIRNSWGPTWGEKGYIRINRSNPDTSCGVDLTPAHGSGCPGGPSTVQVCGTCGILYDNAYPTGASLSHK